MTATPVVIQTAASWYMAGSIWTMQILNYPLLAKVGPDSFVDYERAHNQRFIRVVGPGVLAAVVATILLLADKPASLGWTGPVISGVLLVIVLISTAVYQGKAHGKLTSGYNADTVAGLVKTNWIRTGAWTALGAIDLWMLFTLP
jgi:uncharacterized membrane protein